MTPTQLHPEQGNRAPRTAPAGKRLTATKLRPYIVFFEDGTRMDVASNSATNAVYVARDIYQDKNSQLAFAQSA